MFIVVVLVNTLYISDIFYYIILGKQKSYPELIHFFQGPQGAADEKSSLGRPQARALLFFYWWASCSPILKISNAD
jgi:hypothetical protein